MESRKRPPASLKAKTLLNSKRGLTRCYRAALQLTLDQPKWNLTGTRNRGGHAHQRLCSKRRVGPPARLHLLGAWGHRGDKKKVLGELLTDARETSYWI